MRGCRGCCREVRRRDRVVRDRTAFAPRVDREFSPAQMARQRVSARIRRKRGPWILFHSCDCCSSHRVLLILRYARAYIVDGAIITKKHDTYKREFRNLGSMSKSGNPYENCNFVAKISCCVILSLDNPYDCATLYLLRSSAPERSRRKTLSSES